MGACIAESGSWFRGVLIPGSWVARVAERPLSAGVVAKARPQQLFAEGSTGPRPRRIACKWSRRRPGVPRGKRDKGLRWWR